MARRLHDLSEESDNLIRLSGRRRYRAPSQSGGWRLPWPLSWRLLIPLALLATLIACLVLPTPLHYALLSTTENGRQLTDDQALTLSAMMGFDHEQATDDLFRSAYGQVLAMKLGMQACSDSWSEFRDVSSFMATGMTAIWRAGEITGVLTPALKSEAEAMVAHIDSIRQMGLATLGTQGDRLECLTVAQVYRSMESGFRAAS